MARPAPLPTLQALQSLVHILLVELHHVAVHLFVVVPDIPLGAAIGHCAEAERRGKVVGPLELKTHEGGATVSLEQMGKPEIRHRSTFLVMGPGSMRLS